MEGIVKRVDEFPKHVSKKSKEEEEETSRTSRCC